MVREQAAFAKDKSDSDSMDEQKGPINERMVELAGRQTRQHDPIEYNETMQDRHKYVIPTPAMVSGVVSELINDKTSAWYPETQVNQENMARRSFSLSEDSESEPEDSASPVPQLPPSANRRDNEVFAFQNIKYTIPGGGDGGGEKRILHGVSGSVPLGALCGVLGPSGSGKTTLFDALLGGLDAEHVQGNAPLQEKVAYVTQESQLVVSETVTDVMWFYANLSLPKITSVGRKRQLIEDILFAMDMSHTQDTFVGGVEAAYGVVIEGGLSSGERRRLQVCAALVSEPEIIILDEPTTGLDSTNALHLVRVLRRLCASSHMTALASLHQCRAEVMGELDLLLLMTRGRAVFCGPATHALRFVQSHFRTIKARENPMEFVVDFLTNIPALAADQLNAANNKLVSDYGTVEIVAKMRKMQEQGVQAAQDEPSFFDRVRVLNFRIARIYWYKWSIYNAFGPLFLAVVTGLFLACMCLNTSKSRFSETQSFLNMQALTIFTLARNGIHTSAVCGFTRTCWYQEKSQNLYKATHAFLALLLFELPMGVFFGIVCYLCMWIPVGWGYDAPDRLARAVLLFMVASNAYRSLFTVVQLSSKSSSGPRIIALMSLLEATGGLYMKFKSIPMFCRWVCFINPTFYTMMGLVQIEYQGYLYPKYEAPVAPPPSPARVVPVYQPRQLPRHQDQHLYHNIHEESHVIQDYGFDDFAGSFPYAMLLALYVLYSLIAFCLFVTPVFATKRVVESRAGGPPLVPVAQKEAPVRPVGQERRASMASPARSASSRKSYGSIGTISQKLPAPLSRYKEQKQACVLQYVDINYQVKDAEGNTKEVLRSVSFNVARFSLFAIMGPSGAGKSSLIQVMGGLPLPGEVRAEFLAGIQQRSVGYVTSDDILPVLDTVAEVLMFYAEFTLPTTMSYAEKMERATQVMSVLGLQGSLGSYVGGALGGGMMARGISGGERRRLSMGCALLKNPATLLMDEPTSGLDATMAMEVLELCEYLTRHQRTVVCTIHQPSLDMYHMFLHVLFLAKGEVVYLGPPKLSVQVFQMATGALLEPSQNPADFILDCMVGLDVDEILDMKERIPKGHGPAVPVDEHMQYVQEHEEPVQVLSAPARLTLIASRQLRDIWRNPDQAMERVRFIFITILITALPYGGLSTHLLKTTEITDRRGINILMIIFYTVQASNTIPMIQQQRTLFLHEIKLGFYRPWEIYTSYLLIALFIFATLTATAGFNITWLIAGYRSGWRAWVFGLGNAWFVSAFSETVAVVLAMVMPSFPAAIGTFSGPFTVLCIPLCGLLIPTHKVPVPLRYLAYGNPLRYAAGAEILNQFANRTLIMDDNTTTGLYKNFTSGDDIVEDLGFNTYLGDKFLDMIVIAGGSLVFMFLGYHLVAYIVGRPAMLRRQG